MIDLQVTGQEFHSILAALRYYQENGQGEPANRSDRIHDIATDGDEDISLDEAGIDELCERLNMTSTEGMIQICATASVPIEESANLTEEETDEAIPQITISVQLQSDLYGNEEFNYSSVPEALAGAERLIHDVIQSVGEDGIDRQVILSIASSSDDCT
jgi:hypothetical protein